MAGSLLVFIPAVGEYVIPSLLGRTDQLMVARLLSDEFFRNRDWPKASAVAIAMLLLLVVPIMIFQHFQNRELQARAVQNEDAALHRSRRSRCALGLLFLYAAHPLDDRLLVQQLAAGHGLGLCQLTDPQVVRGAARTTGTCWRRRGCRSGSPPCRPPAP